MPVMIALDDAARVRGREPGLPAREDEQRGAERDEDVRAEAGGAVDLLALRADQPAEEPRPDETHGRGREAREVREREEGRVGHVSIIGVRSYAAESPPDRRRIIAGAGRLP